MTMVYSQNYDSYYYYAILYLYLLQYITYTYKKYISVNIYSMNIIHTFEYIHTHIYTYIYTHTHTYTHI